MRSLPSDEYIGDKLLKVFKAVDDGMFGHNKELKEIIDTIRYQNDVYLVCHDFYSYLDA